jgi:hypothetical protein
LASEIPAGDGKIDNHFFTVYLLAHFYLMQKSAKTPQAVFGTRLGETKPPSKHKMYISRIFLETSSLKTRAFWAHTHTTRLSKK